MKITARNVSFRGGLLSGFGCASCLLLSGAVGIDAFLEISYLDHGRLTDRTGLA